ncbi:MAG: hypothetical protein NC337_04450 [Roseburia sp.]|nr:hypothetical protein [Roseburia sp.]
MKEGTGHDLTWQDQALVVTGRDPYLVLDCPRGIIEDITVQWRAVEGIGRVVCYYDTGSGYTENHKTAAAVTDTGGITLNVRRLVRTVRLDFEDLDEGAAVWPEAVLINYADKGAGGFLVPHAALMLLFDLLLAGALSKRNCSWPGSVAKAVAFAILQYWAFKAYIIASGGIAVMVFMLELFLTVGIIFINLGGNGYAKE